MNSQAEEVRMSVALIASSCLTDHQTIRYVLRRCPCINANNKQQLQNGGIFLVAHKAPDGRILFFISLPPVETR